MHNHDKTSDQTKDTLFMMFVVDKEATIYINTLTIAKF